MEKGTAVWRSFLSIDSGNPDLYELFPPDDKGHYPYIVAAYKLEGDNAWRLTPLPAPFEKAVRLLEDSGIKLQALRQVSLGGAVASLASLKDVYCAGAYNKGWNRDYEDCNRWYAPGENVPPPPYVIDTGDAPISFKLVAIAADWIEFQIRQGEKKQHLIFESFMSDGLPGMTHLLKCLMERGYGHMSLADNFEGFFFRMSVWSTPDGSARMIVTYDGENVKNLQWTSKTNTNAIIGNIREFLLSIADHPDFLHEYAYHNWNGDKGFENELEETTKVFLASPVDLRVTPPQLIKDEIDPPELLDLIDDNEERFRSQWLRENIMRLEPAKEMHEKYQRMLRDLLIPDGWLDFPTDA